MQKITDPNVELRNHSDKRNIKDYYLVLKAVAALQTKDEEKKYQAMKDVMMGLKK